MNKKNILISILQAILLLIFIICLTPKSFQNDSLFDISLGNKYLNEGISTYDDYSIHENLEYTPQHFVVNIITYLVYNSFGFCGLYIWCIILTCFLAILFYIVNKLFCKRKIFSYLFVYAELALIISFISVRAQMYSYIFFLLELIFIEKFLRNKKYIFLTLLSILPLFIINFHAGTIYFYFIIIFVYLLNYIKIKIGKIEYNHEYVTNLKYLLIPIIFGTLLTFVNPFGYKQILYCAKTLNNSFIKSYISEFQPMTIKNSVGILFYGSLLIITLSLIFTKNKIKLERTLLLLGTTFMSLMSLRHFSLFIIFTIPCLEYVEEFFTILKDLSYKGITKTGKKVLKITIISLYISIYIFLGFFYLFKYNTNEYLPKSIYPIDSVNYIKENIGNDKLLFNNYSYGSLLMFNDIKCFIDSRCDLYTKEYNKDCTVAEDYINAINCTGNYEQILDKYNIEYLLISKNSALGKNIFNNSKYEKIFEDKCSYVIKVNN